MCAINYIISYELDSIKRYIVKETQEQTHFITLTSYIIL